MNDIPSPHVLLPCPFCRSEARYEDTDWAHHVTCTGCGAFIGPRGKTKEQIVAAWNIRATIPRPMSREALIPVVRFILENSHKFDWSLQGLGMLRLYLPGDARLHVWDWRFAFPGASPIHDHLQWGLTSTIVSGRITNYRYAEGRGVPFHWARFKAGYHALQLHAPETMLLERGPAEIYLPGDSYSQAPNEIHESVPDEGTVTIMQKRPTPDGETARIFWPVGTSWGSAEPRAATALEVKTITEFALSKLQEVT